jgi:hypothetical protein
LRPRGIHKAPKASTRQNRLRPGAAQQLGLKDGPRLAEVAQGAQGIQPAVGDFRGVKLSNVTHRSTKDPEALLARKSNTHPAELSVRGHVLMENRYKLIRLSNIL